MDYNQNDRGFQLQQDRIQYQHQMVMTAMNLRDNFLTQHITQPTRKTGTDKPSSLCLVITSDKHIVNLLKTETPLGMSDHSMITKKHYMYDNEDYARWTLTGKMNSKHVRT